MSSNEQDIGQESIPGSGMSLRQAEDLLARVAFGRAAKALLEQRALIPRTGKVGLAIAPATAWRKTASSSRFSRKADSGGRLPHHVRWAYGPVFFIKADSERAERGFPVAFTMSNWESSERPYLGQVWFKATETLRAPQIDDLTPKNLWDTIPEVLPAFLVRRATAIRILEDLVTSGDAARWELVERLHKRCANHLVFAAKRVAAELGSASEVVDKIDLEQLCVELQFGSGKSAGELMKAIDRYSAIDRSFPSVDFLRHLRTALNRRADELIRSKIGDPHIGRRFRAVARAHPELSPPEWIEIFNGSGRRDRIGEERAAAALTPGARPDFDQKWATLSADMQDSRLVSAMFDSEMGYSTGDTGSIMRPAHEAEAQERRAIKRQARPRPAMPRPVREVVVAQAVVAQAVVAQALVTQSVSVVTPEPAVDMFDVDSSLFELDDLIGADPDSDSSQSLRRQFSAHEVVIG